jgi:3-deoxy-manno-octulosonate cytidylyltransferase (CMP-KDO synthetase)
MSFKVVIPARYASVRLPGKPLRLIAGKPMVQHVYEKAKASGATQVLVATEDARIEAACRKFGAEVAMTSAEHPSGTDRLAEVATRYGWKDEDIVVNVQGDEPLLPSSLVGQVAELLAGSDAGIATLGVPIESVAEFLDPNAVKVAFTRAGRALYFSRAPIPWVRDGAPGGMGTQTRFDGALRHLGLYAYRVGVLKRLATLPPSLIEQTEKLEQLRALEHGIGIVIGTAREHAPAASVDVEHDIAKVEALLAGAEAGP